MTYHGNKRIDNDDNDSSIKIDLGEATYDKFRDDVYYVDKSKTC